MKPKLFKGAILWHPTEKQIKDEGLKSKVIVAPDVFLAADDKSAAMSMMMKVPTEYKDQLEQIDVVVGPF